MLIDAHWVRVETPDVKQITDFLRTHKRVRTAEGDEAFWVAGDRVVVAEVICPVVDWAETQAGAPWVDFWAQCRI